MSVVGYVIISILLAMGIVIGCCIVWLIFDGRRKS